jgi:hypothetical protein
MADERILSSAISLLATSVEEKINALLTFIAEDIALKNP